jgi:Holliday junction resolvase-like predicted endonuclease
VAVAYDVDRHPGSWVAAQAARRERVLWIGFIVFFLIVGAFLALALGHRVGIAASLVFLMCVVVVWRYANRYVDDLLHWLRGARAEESVGETLNELRREGWILLHDVEQQGEGNIDHIASGPTGVYMIETKQRRYEQRQLRKARRQAAKLHDELDVWVTPVICLHERDSAPFRVEKVWIVPEQHLLDWLRDQHNAPVPFERLARYADQVG